MKISFSALLLAPVMVGCIQTSPSLGESASVTNIPQSPVKDQGQTGNCWLYATGGWIESLEDEVPGQPGTSYSPAYWDYWDWRDQILAGATQLDFGGYWGRAVDIVKRYGMVPMGSFVADDTQGAVDALAAINRALASGILSSADARSDSVRVLRALDQAFGLSDAQTRALVNTFGSDGARTFDLGAPASADFTTVSRAQDLLVETPIPGGIVVATTLDQLIGASAGTGNPDDRVGQYAWTAAYPPDGSAAIEGTPGVYGVSPSTSSASPPMTGTTGNSGTTTAQWRAYQLRLQSALNAFAALPIAWGVAFPDLDSSTGEFQYLVDQVDAQSFGYHESLITDYQITQVPGFGLLPAGVQATPEQETAALDPSAQLSFFRIKNSWGLFAANAPLPGYDDLDAAYLQQPLTVTDSGTSSRAPSLILDVVLPAGF